MVAYYIHDLLSLLKREYYCFPKLNETFISGLDRRNCVVLAANAFEDLVWDIELLGSLCDEQGRVIIYEVALVSADSGQLVQKLRILLHTKAQHAKFGGNLPVEKFPLDLLANSIVFFFFLITPISDPICEEKYHEAADISRLNFLEDFAKRCGKIGCELWL